MTAPLRTSWEIQNASGAPTAVVRVKNLQSTIQGPQDAWGRPNRPQPISVSASVSLAKPFGSSSSTDVVDSDTVHYGLLSKAILRTLDRLAAQARTDQITPLPDVLENVWIDLTGLNTFGKPSGGATEKPFLNTAFVRSLSITVYLPKASLLGAGASLTGSAVFDIDDGGVSMSMRGMSLKVHDLRVPTLIGVNDNERTAKQVVVANVEVDKFDGVGDAYCGLEAVVVEVRKAMRRRHRHSAPCISLTLHRPCHTLLTRRLKHWRHISLPKWPGICRRIMTRSPMGQDGISRLAWRSPWRYLWRTRRVWS